MSGETSPTNPSATPPVGGTPIPVTPVTPLPPENVLHGFLLSLIALPVGIVVYLLVWNLGYIAWIVAFGVAFAARFLYRRGSGGRISMRGALIVGAVTIVTLLIAFFVAEVSNVANVYTITSGVPWIQLMFNLDFVAYALAVQTSTANIGTFGFNLFLTVLFSLIGAGAVLLTTYRENKAAATIAGPPVSPWTPNPPAATNPPAAPIPPAGQTPSAPPAPPAPPVPPAAP